MICLNIFLWEHTFTGDKATGTLVVSKIMKRPQEVNIKIKSFSFLLENRALFIHSKTQLSMKMEALLSLVWEPFLSAASRKKCEAF